VPSLSRKSAGPKYRSGLPQLVDSRLFLTDGGVETDLIFRQGFDLPHFAAFPLLDDPEGVAALRSYYLRSMQAAIDAQAGFVLEAATWRASRDWGSQLGFDAAALVESNRKAVDQLIALRAEVGEAAGPVVVSACIGPRGDAYQPEELMTPAEAKAYHAEQIETLATTDVDMVSALTLTYAAEAIGIVQAAQDADLPVAISFTVETDGRLPDGSSLAAAVRQVDEATGLAAAYYGINCAHPTHFEGVLVAGEPWTERIHMMRGNASRMSHAELDEATELDDGNPTEFGDECVDIRRRFPHLNVLGGCCGTDARHIEAIAQASLSSSRDR
jgi:S-methylmethionine-dependent homocysteine/selenocysteine methylase